MLPDGFAVHLPGHVSHGRVADQDATGAPQRIPAESVLVEALEPSRGVHGIAHRRELQSPLAPEAADDGGARMDADLWLRSTRRAERTKELA